MDKLPPFSSERPRPHFDFPKRACRDVIVRKWLAIAQTGFYSELSIMEGLAEDLCTALESARAEITALHKVLPAPPFIVGPEGPLNFRLNQQHTSKP